MMWPERCRRICGSTARVTPSRPNTLVPNSLAGLRSAGLLDRAQQAVAGIVDQDIDAAELLHRLAGGLVGLCLAGDVEPGRQQPLMGAEARGDGVGIAGGGDHRIARLQRGFRDQGAKPPGSSCDEPDTHFLALSVGGPAGSPNLMGKE